MKKFSLLLTAFVIILTLFIPNLTSAKSFPDVQSNHWAIKEINYLSDKGIINGTPEGTFKPSYHVTRAEMAVVLVKTFNLKPTGVGNRYGHPTQETLAKLNAMSVKVYRTDLNGTVIINSDGSNISVRTER
ncbi:hypothetical protein A3782_01445 [Bacillus sp. GZT]|nr:hypothetical protein A3782_01445 [Bacillus sp. GZT]